MILTINVFTVHVHCGKLYEYNVSVYEKAICPLLSYIIMYSYFTLQFNVCSTMQQFWPIELGALRSFQIFFHFALP